MKLKLKLNWPQAVLASSALVTVGLVLAFAPEDTQSQVLEWLGWGVAALSSFLPGLIGRDRE